MTHAGVTSDRSWVFLGMNSGERNMRRILTFLIVFAMVNTVRALVVLDDDCNFPNGAVTNQNPGVWSGKNPGLPNYNGLGEMRVTSGHAVRSVGEWNPEGDDVYDSTGTEYPLGDPKAVTLSLDFRIDPNQSTVARLVLITRTSDRGTRAEGRGLAEPERQWPFHFDLVQRPGQQRGYYRHAPDRRINHRCGDGDRRVYRRSIRQCEPI